MKKNNFFVIPEATSAKREGYPGSSNQDGFVALVSAVVIASLLIIIGASLGYTGFFSRFNILDGEFKETSIGLAESCAEIARVEIANNSAYPSGTTLPDIKNIGSNSCSIISVANNNPNYTVQSQAVYQKSYTTIEATYNRTGSDVTVTSWREIP